MVITQENAWAARTVDRLDRVIALDPSVFRAYLGCVGQLGGLRKDQLRLVDSFSMAPKVYKNRQPLAGTANRDWKRKSCPRNGLCFY